ncbi:DUF4249 domain-containing protein [Niabella drilacis]|uniref:DUF4249 domain-containing protein n=1 Tax=Niabella drilacis (strain DSM 25811 / CCM 8410 / CCUG 62505 / LMG 26954 / E90) TaxID=1285928 RepID=A0A1G6TWI7_NIADE|nr:DUF4249 domain-containing protein [Niabella drilacis]SDD33419.1 protein of unknown function [Niabella drilacis]
MRAYVPFLVGCSLLAACTKGVRINIPPDRAMPVMTTIITSDTTFAADLSYSRPVLEAGKDYPAIKDATVRLFVDDVFTETLTGRETPQSYQYFSTYKPAAGQKLRIEAKLKDQLLNGTTIIPAKPEAIPGRAYRTEGDGFGNKTYKISFTINDRAGTHDYYQLHIFPVHNGVPDRQKPVAFIIENLKTQEGGIFDDFITPDPAGAHYFDDGPFNGQRFTVQVKSRYPGDFDKIAIQLSALSKEAYLYFKSIQLQQLRNDDPLYEKVTIYSNIVNGLGIAGSANRTLVLQELEK